MYVKNLLIILLLLTASTLFAQNNIKTEQFKVRGSCDMCKERIEATALDHKAKTAIWDTDSQILTISYDSTKVSLSKIKKAIAKSGHDNDEFQAPDDEYKKLPECCRYLRKEEEANKVHSITGLVIEESVKGKLSPLHSATIHNLHSKEMVATDSAGLFIIHTKLPAQVVVSYAGFTSDTLTVNSADLLSITLKNSPSGNLKEVIVTSRNPSSYVSSISVLNKLNLGPKELTKAACCNLSESFETSPSVDVSYSDAVTGVKQIQLLGLSGNYSQLLTENVPEIKGLASHYGMTYVPGPWLEGIQLTKGVGSVVNGYESIAGQINIEEKKPDIDDKFFLNLYGNTMGRMEANINTAHKLNNKWSTGILAHGNLSSRKVDDNKDGFVDIPTGSQWNIINRWKYQDNNGWIVQFALKAMNDKRYAGQIDFDRNSDIGTTKAYGVSITSKQYNFTTKLGYVFPQHKYKSLGLILSAGHYDNEAYYGLTNYDGKQNTIYGNLIYQSIIGNTNHKFKTGFSFSNENYQEKFDAKSFDRNEIIPGAFFEYTYSISEKLTALAGLRADYHNEFGMVTTPRAHIKYDFSPRTNLRVSGGSGFRVSNIFAENIGVFVSSRKYQILNPSNQFGYGLDPEKAWNYGLNFIHNFKINGHKGSIAFDAYRTQFANQTVTDLDANPQSILFYNLKGKSYSNSIQTELNYEIVPKFDLRMAYRWLDVKTNYQNGLLEKPFTAKHRAFINLAYETENKWKFDYTVQWLSKKRIPQTNGNPVQMQMDAYSPSYFQMAGQISKQFSKRLEVYLGGENLTNFVQMHRIIDAANPFGDYFDGSMVWGPVVGRMIYAGLRFSIPSK
ncbi:MAG TPA: TonB-dependent receptor [Niabella sp.]|nr:TonB-dependent receptor [Niabella sp.]HOZ95562.1 TonB-dependent receptor [Niabella sp.]HQW13802.1 TonB-dependent receptor [Niabella sp.]HQX19305.1 TonB-dependent receptor [Niabella sp.]HQX40839.1 TonB-dependent receptor [Niabella sp.]